MGPDTLDVQFFGSFPSVEKCPVFAQPEYCFIGRSNVGKSSIINYLTGMREMARTSKKPGKTQTINIYKVMENPEWVIADLPGYGYAHVSRTMRGQWSTMIEHYILRREYLMSTFVLIDIRHTIQENDRAFLQFLGEHQIPFCLLFTKSDKLKPTQLHKALIAYEEALLASWESMPPYIVTSSLAHKGRDEILQIIRDINHTFASSEYGNPS